MAKKEKIGVGLNPIEVQKVDEYNKIIYGDNNRKREHTINQIIHEYFENTKLTNDFIELDKPVFAYTFSFFENASTRYYDNMTDIMESDLDNTFVIKKIPNNFDEFNKDSRTFCFNNEPGRHKGCHVYHSKNKPIDIKGVMSFRCALIFDYYDETYKIPKDSYIKNLPYLKIVRLDDIKNLKHMIFNHPNKDEIRQEIFMDYGFEDEDDIHKYLKTWDVIEPIKEYTSNEQLKGLLNHYDKDKARQILEGYGGALQLLDSMDDEYFKDDD